MKYKRRILELIKKKDLTTKIYIYMSSKSAGDDFDSYEQNYTNANLNPLVIKGYVRELSAEQAFYKQYGLHQSGMKEILCEEKYRNYFEKCNKIEIDSIEYQVFKSGTGGRTLIEKRPYRLLRVVVSRKD